MRPFKWSTAKAVYLPEIDAEHRELFQLAEQLHCATIDGSAPQAVDTLLDGLVEHVVAHFEHEERMMQDSDYPSRDWHIRQHQTAARKTTALVEMVRQGDPRASLELLEFLHGWLRDHIGVADKMLGSYLRNHRRLARAS